MKRIPDENPIASPLPGKKTPTIDNILYSMAADGLDTYQGRLETYANLGYHFDGIDHSKDSTRKLTKLITVMDALVPDFKPEHIDDEDADRFGFVWDSVEYWFTSPNLKQLPKAKKEDMPRYLRELIEKTADHPEQIMDLPYFLFPVLGDVLGKLLGIA